MFTLNKYLTDPTTKLFRWLARTICMLAVISTPICWAQQNTDAASSKAISEDPEYLSKLKIGSATSSLLKLQIEGTHAGNSLPMLGSTTHLSWQRYQNSFKQEIPATFAKTVKSSDAD